MAPPWQRDYVLGETTQTILREEALDDRAAATLSAIWYCTQQPLCAICEVLLDVVALLLRPRVPDVAVGRVDNRHRVPEWRKRGTAASFRIATYQRRHIDDGTCILGALVSEV